MKILVTGNLGYVGPAVVKEVRRAMPESQILGCDPGWFASRVSTDGRAPETYLDNQIFKDCSLLSIEDLADIDVIVQLAAVSNDPMGQTYESATDLVNHRAAVELAKRAKNAGVKHFVFASSASVYGVASSICDEQSPLNPQTAYARSKVATERALASLADSNLSVTCLRFSTACGWSDRVRLDLVLNDFVSSAIINGEIRLISDGSPLRPLIATTDMARAVAGTCLGSWSGEREACEVINVGSDEWNFTIGDLARRVGRRLGDLPVVLGSQGGVDTRSYALSFAKFRQLLPEWQPVASLDQVIDELSWNLRRVLMRTPGEVKDLFIRLRTLDSLRESEALTNGLTWS